MRARLGGDQMTQSRLRLLMALRLDGAQPMSALAAQLSMTPRAITGLVDALERDGHVARSPHPRDRRVTLVALTPGGEHACDEVLPPRLQAVATLFEVLDPAERRSLLAVLERVTAELRASGR